MKYVKNCSLWPQIGWNALYVLRNSGARFTVVEITYLESIVLGAGSAERSVEGPLSGSSSTAEELRLLCGDVHGLVGP